MIKLSHDEIWYWYCAIQQQLDSGEGIKCFCEQRGIEYKKFSNMSFRILYKKFTDPMRHKKLLDLARQCSSTGGKLQTFARDHHISYKHLTETITHLNYLAIIEKIKREREPLPLFPIVSPRYGSTRENVDPVMTFHQVSGQGTPRPKIDIKVPLDEYDDYIEPQQQLAPQAEVIEPRNDIELSIAQGIKVLVSPNIDSMKIIKIIELLKDL